MSDESEESSSKPAAAGTKEKLTQCLKDRVIIKLGKLFPNQKLITERTGEVKHQVVMAVVDFCKSCTKSNEECLDLVQHLTPLVYDELVRDEDLPVKINIPTRNQ